MSNVIEYNDMFAFHPGYYVAEVIDDMGITQAEFATRLGTTTKTLSCLVNGQANISNDLAKKLSVMMGTSEELWLNLQNAYDKKLIEIQKEKDIAEQESLARLLDYSYFMGIGGLPATKDMKERITNLCRYLHVSDLRNMLTPDFLISFKTDNDSLSEKNIINSRAWIQTAINISQEINVEDYNPGKLKASLPKLRGMTKQSPSVYVPQIRGTLAACGVAFVHVPDLKNSEVKGAVKWINDKRVVLAMNSRLETDEFWFSLFHEIRHVFQKKNKTTFISYSGNEIVMANKLFEDDADCFAVNYLIPADKFKKFSPTKATSDDEIISFADSIDVNPGIVAYQLWHEGIISRKRRNEINQKWKA